MEKEINLNDALNVKHACEKMEEFLTHLMSICYSITCF